MSDEHQLERIFNTLDAIAREQAAQGKVLVRVDTQLEEHIKGSGPIREKVEEHEQTLARMRGAGWLLGILWSIMLAIVGFFAKHNAAAK